MLYLVIEALHTMAFVEKQIASKIAKAKNLSVSELGLRFDRVVIRLIEDLRTFSDTTVPKGLIVLVTVTAPIRQPAKTTAVLKNRIEILLRRGSRGQDYKTTIYENRVRVRLLKTSS